MGLAIKTAPPPPAEVDFEPLTWEPSEAFLRYAIGAILVSVALVTFCSYYFFPELGNRSFWPVAMVPVALLGWYFIVHKKPQAAISCLAVGMWGCTAVLTYVGGGVGAPVQHIFTLIIFMLGWLSSTRAAFMAAGLTVLFTVATAALETLGLLPYAPANPPAVMGVVQVCVFLMAAVIVHSSVRAYRQRLQELERTKSELNEAQGVAKVGSWVFDLESNVSFPSDETCRILGIAPGSTFSSDTYLDRTHPDDRDLLLSAWKALLQDHREMDIEHRIVINKTVRWIRLRAGYDPGQFKITRLLGTIQDVNDRKLAELSVQDSERDRKSVV